jgi:hypothetical protein
MEVDGMNKEYLLTFKIQNAGYDFEWFDTEEELKDRIFQLGSYISEIDAIHIKDCEPVEV